MPLITMTHDKPNLDGRFWILRNVCSLLGLHIRREHDLARLSGLIFMHGDKDAVSPFYQFIYNAVSVVFDAKIGNVLV